VNKYTTSSTLTLSTAIALALAAVPQQGLMAQDSTENNASETVLEEVLVTASRREESLQDTGLSVTAWQPEEFVEVGLDSIRDVIEYSPGVYYQGGSTPQDNAITMRGISNFTSSPSVGIYVDDIPIGSGGNNAAGGTLALDAMQLDLQRVEVIKGPQGTLYGASAMGGVLRYITRDASMDEFSGVVSADWSNIEHGEFSQKYSARISTPLISERLGLSLSGSYEDIGGFIDRIPEAVSGAAKNVNGNEGYSLMAKLNANITDRFSASLMAMGIEKTWNGANVVPVEGPPFKPVYGPYDTDTSYSDDEYSMDIIGLTLDYEFDHSRLISSTSYQELQTSAVTDLVVAFGPLIELFAGEPVTEAPFTGGYSTERFVQEVRLESDSNEEFEWTIGAIYSDEESGNLQRLEGLPSEFLLLDVNIPSTLEELAGFGSITWYLNPDFDLTFGGRLARVKTTVAVDDGPEILVSDTPPVDSSNNIDTWSLAARWRPSDNLSLYSRLATGYRPENANLPLKDENGNNVAPLVVETDELLSFEVGAKGSTDSGRLSYDVAAWYQVWDNLQARIFVNGAMTGGNANSDVTAYGFEGTVNWSPFDPLTLIASAAYTDSTLDDDETSAFGAVAGENIPGVPEWTLSGLARYDFAVTDNVDGFVGAGLRYIGDRDTGFEGGTGSDGSVITPMITNFVIDSFVLADAHVGFVTDRFTTTLYVTNLFDEYAYSAGSARPSVGTIRATTSVVTPRTIGGRISINF
jgi:outer membrane receptor protein involved in Fe transport